MFDKLTKDNIDNSGADTKLENAEPVQEQKEVQPESETQETTVLEEVTEEEPVDASTIGLVALPPRGWSLYQRVTVSQHCSK